VSISYFVGLDFCCYCYITYIMCLLVSEGHILCVVIVGTTTYILGYSVSIADLMQYNDVLEFNGN
jgi:hypothetical protein